MKTLIAALAIVLLSSSAYGAFYPFDVIFDLWKMFHSHTIAVIQFITRSGR